MKHFVELAMVATITVAAIHAGICNNVWGCPSLSTLFPKKGDHSVSLSDAICQI